MTADSDDWTLGILQTARDSLILDLEAAQSEAETLIRTHRSLSAVCRFLLDAGIQPNLWRALDVLKGEIFDEIEHSAGRPPSAKPLHEAIDLATCAAMVTLLHRNGKPVKNALSAISKATGGVIKEKQLREHRNNLSAGRAVRAEAKEWYDNMVRTGGVAYDVPESDRCKAILDTVRTLMGPASARNRKR